jgi:hypothetical protein
MSQIWSTYEYQPSFVLGFHGCDEKVGEAILRGKEDHLIPSEKDYDWLGHGIYFWEGNPARAFQWAENRKKSKKIKKPFVLGAIIDLGRCLDLFDQGALDNVLVVHDELIETYRIAGMQPPINVGETPDKAGRKLDCMVLNTLHLYRSARNQPAYDSIRGPFLEGGELYTGAGFQKDTHIQLCVRNTDCIKGYFRPILKQT